jgi:hypothetical protein
MKIWGTGQFDFDPDSDFDPDPDEQISNKLRRRDFKHQCIGLILTLTSSQ